MTTYLDAVLNGELEELRGAAQGGNNTLFQVAARLYSFVAAGAFDADTIADLLTGEARALKLSHQEIKDTLKSARKAGERSPATLPDQQRGTAIDRLPPRPVDPPLEVEIPPAAWQTAAAAFLEYTQDYCWSEDHADGLGYLAGRGISAVTAFNAGLGYLPQRLERSRARWGLPADDEHGDTLYLPSGIVIPYHVERQVVKLEIRSLALGKYTLPGSANALWGVDRLRRNRPVVLVEGVLNALSVLQEAGDLIVPVAIGATTHARRIRWIAPLAAAPLVLIATDAGPAGEAAADYWLEVLRHNALRWRPYSDDPNTMLRAGMSVREWVLAGL